MAKSHSPQFDKYRSHISCVFLFGIKVCRDLAIIIMVAGVQHGLVNHCRHVAAEAVPTNPSPAPTMRVRELCFRYFWHLKFYPPGFLVEGVI